MHTRSDEPHGIVSRKQLGSVSTVRYFTEFSALLHRGGRAMQAFPELWIEYILSAWGYYDF